MLRQSFMAAVRDSEFQALGESHPIDCDDVRGGPQFEAVVRQIYDFSQPLRKRLLAI